jgi:lambda family phage portal protein
VRLKLNVFDRLTMPFAPLWTARRALAREHVRNYEAAQGGRRTSGWQRNRGDVNSVLASANVELRLHARDLIRNEAWAKRAANIVVNNTVGWGLVARAQGGDPKKVSELWEAWAGTTQCDADGRLPFAGIQSLALRSIFESGEVLIRRRPRRPSDGLAIPLQLQVLEADHLDSGRDLPKGVAGGPIINGVEFDAIGRRAAYWLFPQHPGSRLLVGESVRVPATEILHVYRIDRPGQARGVSWLAAAIVNLKDLSEYEDAELMKQKVAACFGALVTDLDGQGTAIGDQSSSDPLIETFEPGMVGYLPPGKDVKFATPPGVTADTFAIRNLRKIAAGLDVPYEEMTGDYSTVNFSSARMSRLAHWAGVWNWRELMLVPQLCNPVFAWAMESAFPTQEKLPTATWSAPPMPMIEPDKEGLAIGRMIRNGMTTLSGAIREQGGVPEQHFKEYADDLKKLKALGIKLDSNAADTSQAGLTQERAGVGEKGDGPPAAAKPKEKRDAEPTPAADEVTDAERVSFLQYVRGGKA